MQRDKYLRDLSSEHHQALALSRDIRKACEKGDTVAALIERVESVFRSELLPHFQVEEQTILPALERIGEQALVEKTLQDHRQLEHLAAHLETPGHLSQFAELLRQHVRFEERELFETCQTLLDEETLAGIALHSASGSA